MDKEKNVLEIMELSKNALMNASGAYRILQSLGLENHLPGLNKCEEKRKEALNAINDFLTNNNQNN